MNITQEQLDDAVLEITGRPEWAMFVQGLFNEIYQSQARALTADSWEEVNRLRGFAEGLAYVSNVREMVTQSKEQADASL